MGFWNDGIRSPSPSRSHSPRRRRKNSSTYSSSSYNRSRSWFGGGGSSSYSRARPRSGFINRLRRFLRDLYSYLRRHPVKVFFLVIMPLITGGALTKILAQFGVRLPRGLEAMVGRGNRAGGDRFFARGGARDFQGGSALPGMMDGLGGLMGIAKMFM